MSAPFPAYDGDGPYLFVSYAHADAERIYPELAFLRDAGINVWYDEGITPGSRWSDELANAIDHADLFLVFLTKASVRSEHCLNEMEFALSRRRPFLAVELETVALPPGIELNIGNRQSILAHRFNEADYRARLLDAISGSRSEKRSRRGAGLAHAPPPVDVNSRHRAMSARLLGAIAVALLVAGAYFLGTPPSEEGSPDTLAVLPFTNLSRDSEFDYLGDGLADELITALGGLPWLSVSSRTSSFYYRDQAPRMQDIQDRLGVAYAVEGSLRTESSGIVINVSLFETSQGRQIWTRQYGTTTADIGRTTNEIATEIARELNPAYNLSQLNPEPSSDGVSAKAYEAYLRGLDFLARPPTPETLDAASLFFSSALEMEPNFGRASAALCETYLAYYRMARTDEIQTYYDKAVRRCEAAIELDATHWAGHQSLATLYRLSGRFEDALREIRLADTLHPDTASVHYEYGKILAVLGEPEGAEEKLIRGIELDPGFWGGYADLGDHLYLMGRYEEALAQFHKAAQLSPDNDLMAVSLGATYYMLDRPQDAHASWKRAIRDNPDSESRAFWQSATWLGINSLNMSCPEEAAYWQQQAISVSGSDHRLWGRLAESCQMQQTDYSTPDETARQIYERAIELAEEELAANPNDWESLGLLAVYRARTGAGNDSQRLIDRMLEMQPDNPDALEIALHFAVQQDNERASETLQLRLRGFNYPPSLLERNPYIGGLKQCATEADEKEHLICAQGRIIPALRN